MVTATDALSVPMPRNGGFASALCPYTAGMTTCGSADDDGVLKGQESGRCVDVPGRVRTDGTDVKLWDCNGGANQTWTSTTSNQLRIYPTECLGVTGGATADGSAVVISDCDNTSSQQWRVLSSGAIVNVASGSCLDAYDGGIADGTQAIIWPCSGAANQKWTRN